MANLPVSAAGTSAVGGKEMAPGAHGIGEPGIIGSPAWQGTGAGGEGASLNPSAKELVGSPKSAAPSPPPTVVPTPAQGGKTSLPMSQWKGNWYYNASAQVWMPTDMSPEQMKAAASVSGIQYYSPAFVPPPTPPTAPKSPALAQQAKEVLALSDKSLANTVAAFRANSRDPQFASLTLSYIGSISIHSLMN